MYVIKNALQNLVRNRGRNLMVGGIIFVIIVSVVTALMINNTSNGVISDYKTRFGSQVTISLNLDKLRSEATTNSGDGGFRMIRPQISPAEYIKYGQSDYLQKSVYDVSANANSANLTAVNADKGPGGGFRFRTGGPGGAQSNSSSSASTTTAASSTEIQSPQYYFRLTNNYSDFENSGRTIDTSYDTAALKSRLPENNNECMLSANLMAASKLKLGDKITVTSELSEFGTSPADQTYTEVSWNLTVVGVYSDVTQTDAEISQLSSAFEDRRNEILTTLDTLIANVQDGKNGINVSATYYLKNPSQLSAYTAELRGKGLSDDWNVTADSASYDQVVKPVEGLRNISLTFVIIVLIFGAIILALLASIAIRERKYEIGVLRAMGMKKLKVMAGLWAETLMITAACLIVGLVVGVAVAQPVTNILYQQQVAAAQQPDNSGTGGFAAPDGSGRNFGGGRGGMGADFFRTRTSQQTDVKPLANLNVSLDWVTVLEIIGIALLLSSLAGVIATQKIAKYEPIKILMERN